MKRLLVGFLDADKILLVRLESSHEQIRGIFYHQARVLGGSHGARAKYKLYYL